MINQDELLLYQKCSSDLWKLFKDLSTSEYKNKERAMDSIFESFRLQVKQYEGQRVHSYAVQNAHVYITELERLLYPGKPRPEVTRSTQRMNYAEFVEYMKNPTPGDMVTVIDDNDGILSRIKVRTVIDR